MHTLMCCTHPFIASLRSARHQLAVKALYHALIRHAPRSMRFLVDLGEAGYRPEDDAESILDGDEGQDLKVVEEDGSINTILGILLPVEDTLSDPDYCPPPGWNLPPPLFRPRSKGL